MKGLETIFDTFCAEGSWLDARSFGSGHIHDTYLVRTAEYDKPDYILQCINHLIFPDVDKLMQNIMQVTSHIDKRYDKQGLQQLLKVYPGMDGKPYYQHPDGTYWRLYNRINGTYYDKLPHYRLASEAGRAFGQFIHDLSDLPADDISTLIPGFHHLGKRYESLRNAISEDRTGRVAQAGKEIASAYENYARLQVITAKQEAGEIPLRITHNDTKLNNIIFNEDGMAVCVVDLDTVMPGLSLYDFGDAIRTIANTSAEDEPEPHAVGFSMPAFKSFSDGFLAAAGTMLEPIEVELLPLSMQYITYIMGIRFLTDFLEGDHYFPVKYSSHNLVRSRAQFRLVECMKHHYHECEDYIMRQSAVYK